jgi:DNA-binding transcriptional LysR family regulator
MTITQIRYFLDTAKFKSFTRAASNSFVVQQVVSKQVKRLEDELGFFASGTGKRTVPTDSMKKRTRQAGSLLYNLFPASTPVFKYPDQSAECFFESAGQKTQA